MIRARSPFRISFAGGGTDVSPYPETHGGAVVSVTVAKFAYASLLPKAEAMANIRCDAGALPLIHTVTRAMNRQISLLQHDIHVHGQVPPRSGLGSSAATAVAIIGAIDALAPKLTGYEIAELAYKVERDDLKVGCGRQDQFATVFGGLNYIEFGNNRVRVTPLEVKHDTLLELERNLLLVFVKPRDTDQDIIGDQVKRFEQNEKGTVEALHRTKELANEMRRVLRRGDLTSFAELLHQGWMTKKKFSPYITDPFIDEVYELARGSGALGGKLLGAGGGGYMVLYCEPEKDWLVAQNVKGIGLEPEHVGFTFKGLDVWEA